MFLFYYLVSILISILKVSLSGFISIVFIKVKFIKYKLENVVAFSAFPVLGSECLCPMQKPFLSPTKKSTLVRPSLHFFCPTGLLTDQANWITKDFLILHSLYKRNHVIQSL